MVSNWHYLKLPPTVEIQFKMSTSKTHRYILHECWL